MAGKVHLSAAINHAHSRPAHHPPTPTPQRKGGGEDGE